MDPEGRNFGKGPNELTGAGDLLSHFKLLPHYEYFCKRPLPLSISNTSYLLRMVGDTEIRKGEGMQLDQLIQNASTRDTNINIRPFGLDVLRDAFQFKEGGPVDLPQAEKGVPTFPSKSNSEIKDKEKKHRKHKDRDSEKDRVHKKHKHRHKDRSKDMHKEKRDRSARPDSGVDQSKKHEKLQKRKHDGDENISDVHRHKKSKHKSSKLDDMGAIRVAG